MTLMSKKKKKRVTIQYITLPVRYYRRKIKSIFGLPCLWLLAEKSHKWKQRGGGGGCRAPKHPGQAFNNPISGSEMSLAASDDYMRDTRLKHTETVGKMYKPHVRSTREPWQGRQREPLLAEPPDYVVVTRRSFRRAAQSRGSAVLLAAPAVGQQFTDGMIR